MIAVPNWKGDKPEKIYAVITTDAHMAFVVFRTQLFSLADLDNFIAIQDQYQARTISAFLRKKTPEPEPDIDFPTWDDTSLKEKFYRC